MAIEWAFSVTLELTCVSQTGPKSRSAANSNEWKLSTRLFGCPPPLPPLTQVAK